MRVASVVAEVEVVVYSPPSMVRESSTPLGPNMSGGEWKQWPGLEVSPLMMAAPSSPCTLTGANYIPGLERQHLPSTQPPPAPLYRALPPGCAPHTRAPVDKSLAI